MLIPSIDLMDGRAVQLVEGRRKELERDDVLELARSFRVFGDIAVIDLDAAMGRGDNLPLIERLCREADCRVGGGIRDRARAERLLRAGARKIIVGTAADEALLRQLPRDKVMVAVDHHRGRLLSHGWRQEQTEAPLARIRRLSPFCGGFLVTQVHHEGHMAGFDREEIDELLAATDRPVTCAGGITTAEEAAWLDARRVDAQVGMALYTGRLDAADAFIACADFAKGDGRLPCVVTDTAGRLRMLAWQTPDSLRQALRTGRGSYFSRSRQAIWVKGETSGHTQILRRADLDCDRDTIRFIVDQTGPTCHTGAPTCFGDLPFALADLEALLRQRVTEKPEGSYTARLAADPDRLAAKLREETEEVITAPDTDNLVWECADLIYFLMVRMAGAGIGLRQVLAELERRRETS